MYCLSSDIDYIMLVALIPMESVLLYHIILPSDTDSYGISITSIYHHNSRTYSYGIRIVFDNNP
jgi:hypothetical protein